MLVPKKIFFFFNQLLEPKLYTGGEIRGSQVLKYFQNDSEFNVTVISPKIASNNFRGHHVLNTGFILPEKSLPRQNLIVTIVMYIFRSFESLKYLSEYKNNYLYSTGDFFCNTFPAFITKLFFPRTHWVVIIHHINSHPFIRQSNSFTKSLFSYLLQRLSFFFIAISSNTIFTVNRDVKDYLLSIGFRQHIFVVGNGLDTKTILSDIKSLGKISPKNQLCYFGRLSPTKGVLDLPEIFSAFLVDHPQYTLNLVGYGDQNFVDILKKKFDQHHCLDKTIFQGYLSKYADVYKTILSSKVCLFPSYEEGWGISLFEATMCQRPIVAYDLPVYRELFGTFLTTVNRNDIKAFSKKISESINISKNTLLKRSIKHCYQTALKYDWKHVYLQEKTHLLSQS